MTVADVAAHVRDARLEDLVKGGGRARCAGHNGRNVHADIWRSLERSGSRGGWAPRNGYRERAWQTRAAG